MFATEAYVTGNTVTVQNDLLKEFDGQKIKINLILPEHKECSINRFFEIADQLHLNSNGQKWTREELHERQDFYNVVSGKLKCPKDIAKQLVENVASDFTVHKNSVQDILRAIEISIRTQFSFWDSLIISAALAENCTTLYSEDLNDGQTVEGMLIYNPL